MFLVLCQEMPQSRVRFAGGVGGFNPPNDFFDPPSLRRFELLGGSILTPVLVLHVSACGASTLLPDGDPPPMFFFTNRSLPQSAICRSCIQWLK